MHRFKIKIYYEDTDAAGVVYYGNYLRYLERARTEFLLEHGIDVSEFHDRGYFFPVTHVDIYYKQPAKLGDIIEITTEIEELRNASITIKNQIFRADALFVEAYVTLAYIDRDGRPRRLPYGFMKIKN